MKVMRWGFTGTREGMTPAQRQRVRDLLTGGRTFAHGDCVGADAEAHDTAEELGLHITIHPPTDETLRAFKKGHFTCKARPYMARNRSIVDGCDCLIAAPKEDAMQQRGGTWSTVRYAMKARKPIKIIYPSGHMTEVGA